MGFWTRAFDTVHRLQIVRCREHTRANVDHAVLQGVDDQTRQGIELVAGEGTRVGEGSGDLVFPRLSEPFFCRHLHEAFHLRRDIAHVSRASEDDGIGVIQIVETVDGLVGGQEFGINTINACGTKAAYKLVVPLRL